MAADTQVTSLTSIQHGIALPSEIICNILSLSTTPTFVQLTRTSKQFFNVASNNREILLQHLNQLPGDKTNLETFDNRALFLLLRQRAANNLYGTNFTANVTEHLVNNASLDPVSSSISGLDADYVRMALVFKDNTDIRQYTSHCAIKEKIEQPPGTRILKLVQWGRFISALCAWSKETEHDFSDDSDACSSDSETEILVERPFPPTANARLTRIQHMSKDSKIGYKKRPEPHDNKIEYRIVHYDIYTIEDSQTFIVKPHQDYVPHDFAVHSSLQCAILWDHDTPTGRPTEDAVVMYYTASEPQLLYATEYNGLVVWPKAGKPERRDSESDDDEALEYLPGSIAFFKEGRRIKMYDAGGVVPYQIFSTATTQHEPYASTNTINFDGFSFHVDTPFFGTHERHRDDLAQQEYCFQTHLCLGLTTMDVGVDEDEKEVRMLCILRSQSRYYPESCDHKINLQRMAHVSAGNSTVVARLWGWEEMHTTLTGKDMVAISPGGTRIAIAMWDKILVYSLNPKILCAEVVVDSDEEGNPKSKKRKKKSKKPWETATSRYYNRKQDKNLLGWKVAELRPIVLSLNGAVAHKMNWSVAKGKITDTAELIEKAPGSQPLDLDEEDVVVVVEPDQHDLSEDASDDSTVTAIVDAGTPTTNVSSVIGPPATPPANEENELSIAILTPTTDSPHQTQGTESEQEQSIAEVAQSTVAADQQMLSSGPPSSPQTVLSNINLPLVSLTNGFTSSLPSLSLNPLSTTMPSSPVNSFGSPLPPQPSKPSSRKKEKGPDTHSNENSFPYNIDKIQSAFNVVAISDNKPSAENLTPLPPVTSKEDSETKQQTASGVLSTAVNLPQPLNGMQISGPQHSGNKLQSLLPTSPSPDGDSVTSPMQHPNVTMEFTKDEVLGEDVNADAGSSKAPASHCDDEKREDEDKTKHRKRVMEEELVILTDCGIQVWNLGSRAKGKRKRLTLPLEESLRGRTPGLDSIKR